MDRDFFESPALEVAPELLGSLLTVVSSDGTTTIRITEVEAYHGVGTPGPHDSGSHSRTRKTARNASMFGPPGHAYVYLSHGIHYALNFVCSPDGVASGVLIRAGEVVDGIELARSRSERGRSVAPIPDHRLARGPGNLAAALGISRPEHNGRDLLADPFRLERVTQAPSEIQTGPRVGVSGDAGGPAFPWRFWLPGDPTVSAYRPGRNVPRF